MPKPAQNTALLAGASTAALAATGLLVCYVQQKLRKSSKHAIPDALLASPLSKELQVAVDLALRAGHQMYAYCDDKGTARESLHNLGVETKGQPEDFCTQVDVENERFIMEGLLHHFPQHAVIGEETTGTGKIPTLTQKPTWIIDPIDGTTNFAAGLPLTCVSIGLCLNEKPILGVVYAPMTDELYLGISGFGAFRNGVRILNRQHPQNTDVAATDSAIGSKALVDAVVCFEFGYARDTVAIRDMTGVVQRLLTHGCRTTRSLGSGVLDLCWVATGRLDVVYAGVAGEGWKPWDYCAGMVMVQEAGCALETIPGDSPFTVYSKSHICAVNKSLVQEMRQVILDK